MPASLSKVVSVDGAMPTPSCVPKGKAGERGEGLFGVGPVLHRR